MSKKIQRVRASGAARMVLTDTIPYELPLYFSNERLYQALSDNSALSPLVQAVLDVRRDTIPYAISINAAGGKVGAMLGIMEKMPRVDAA